MSGQRKEAYGRVQMKRSVTLIFVLWCGIVAGGLLSEVLDGIKFLDWLSYGQYFGTNSPLILDLGVIVLTFGVQFHITVAGIIGMLVALLLYSQSAGRI